MDKTTNTIEAEVLRLSPADRLELVDKILVSLDEPDIEIDRLWSKEAEERIAAYRRGELKAIHLDEVLDKYRSS
ncbi:MAG: addiction module protein [Magnetococcales bacterium]|nr:addiction module protein [Magnetococcales bacterium]